MGRKRSCIAVAGSRRREVRADLKNRVDEAPCGEKKGGARTGRRNKNGKGAFHKYNGELLLPQRGKGGSGKKCSFRARRREEKEWHTMRRNPRICHPREKKRGGKDRSLSVSTVIP